MPAVSQSSLRNRLLTALAPGDFSILQPHLERIELPLRFVLTSLDEPISHAYFPEEGVGSVIATSPDEEKIEVGHIGREGMGGTAIVLGVERTLQHTFMQVPGWGHRIGVDELRAAMNSAPRIRDLLLRYVYTIDMQVAHSALANARYNMNERLARWLLMCHDRIDGDDLLLTHEFLSLMLGVRRSGVTNELHIIEGVGIIKASRGNIRVLDRRRLEEIAGGCYGMPEREYDRLIAPYAADA